MTVLTGETKAKAMRNSMAKLYAQYVDEDRPRDADKVHMIIKDLSNESMARLYDIILGHTAAPQP